MCVKGGRLENGLEFGKNVRGNFTLMVKYVLDHKCQKQIYYEQLIHVLKNVSFKNK